jgi:hypothetical protein
MTSTSIMPRLVCGNLDLPTGSTYEEGAQEILSRGKEEDLIS